MKYDVILFTRGLTKEEDYHWCRCPEYIKRKEVYDYLQPLIEYVRSCTNEINKSWEKQYVFLNLEKYSLCIRLYESVYTDFCGRNIFVMEGIACSNEDRNFMFNDLVNVVQYFEESQESIQEIYYRQGESKCIDIPEFVNPKAYENDEKVGIYSELVRFISHQSAVCNVFVGGMDSITPSLFKHYHFANTNADSEVKYQHIKQEYTERKNYDVKMKIAMGKKWLAEYGFNVCAMENDSVYARLENDCFDAKIEYANLYAENKLLNHIMDVLWG